MSLLLDSLCDQGHARKSIHNLPGHQPEHPYKSLGAGLATTYFNPVSVYTLDFFVLKRDNTRFLVHPKGNPGMKVGELEAFVTWLQSVMPKGGYTQEYGLAFSGSGCARNADMPYRAKHTQTMDVDWLFGLMGSIGISRGVNLDAASGLLYLTNLIDLLKGTPKDVSPCVCGVGVLNPDEYRRKLEEANREYEKNRNRSPVEKPKQHSSDSSSKESSGTSISDFQTEKVEIKIVAVPDTITLVNDTSSMDLFLDGVYRKSLRDSIAKTGFENKMHFEEEWLRRKDTTYIIRWYLTEQGLIYVTGEGERISKQKYEEIKNSN